MDTKETKKAAIEFVSREKEIITNMSAPEKSAMLYAVVAAVVIGAIFAAIVFWMG